MLKTALLIALLPEALLAAPHNHHRSLHAALVRQTRPQPRGVLDQVESALGPASIAAIPAASAVKSAIHNAAPARPAIFDEVPVLDFLKEHLPRKLARKDEEPCDSLNSREDKPWNVARALGEGLLEKVTSILPVSLGGVSKEKEKAEAQEQESQTAAVGEAAEEEPEEPEEESEGDYEVVEVYDEEAGEAEDAAVTPGPTRRRTRYRGKKTEV